MLGKGQNMWDKPDLVDLCPLKFRATIELPLTPPNALVSVKITVHRFVQSFKILSNDPEKFGGGSSSL